MVLLLISSTSEFRTYQNYWQTCWSKNYSKTWYRSM